MARSEPSRLGYALGSSADVAALPETSDSVASSRGLFPFLTQVPVEQGGAYPRRQDINALIALLGAAQYFQECGGVWSYDASRAASYAAGDVVWYDPEADLYADLPVPDGQGGYTVDTVLLSAVAASGGYPAGAALLFVRNGEPAGSGSFDPVITRAGRAVVNSTYWSPLLGLEQYARLYDAIQQSGGGGAAVDWATVPETLAAIAVSPVIRVDTSGLTAGAQAYVYIIDGGGNAITAAFPGDALLMIGDSTALFPAGTALPDRTADYSLVFSASGVQTGSIPWAGAGGLDAAQGHLIRVSSGSTAYTIEE